ncbi:hypothetical protein TNIN_286111 [Trichonephila inaurata madagascariensis]|uniref:Uncharacterized protein n=1 Tax=Trichonephila inaurata madagascariensis TaxID=2747483 RepID=A0A8X6MFL4_9ARAC|nr:hypothetical protein TNIN_286111 [Trichonephila inaurata madagascariensis]
MFSTLETIGFIFLFLTQNICYCSNPCGKAQQNMDTESEASENDLLKFGLKTAAIAGATLVAAPAVLTAAGFGAGGIAAGSLAAAVQGTWFGGTIAGISGAIFSGLQGMGAAGLGTAVKTAIVAGSGAGVKVYDMLKGDKSNDEMESKSQGCTEA